ncbi:MAG: hypothetical protein ACRCYP_03660 [Alphaproteobacteria bacterium]
MVMNINPDIQKLTDKINSGQGTEQVWIDLLHATLDSSLANKTSINAAENMFRSYIELDYSFEDACLATTKKILFRSKNNA